MIALDLRLLTMQCDRCYRHWCDLTLSRYAHRFAPPEFLDRISVFVSQHLKVFSALLSRSFYHCFATKWLKTSSDNKNV